MKRPHSKDHWTEYSVDNYRARISFDFLAQIEQAMESALITHKDLADKLGVEESSVWELLDGKISPNLETIIKYARALGLKVSIVAYDDGDSGNHLGPVNSEIFTNCWERQGKPRDFFALQGTGE